MTTFLFPLLFVGGILFCQGFKLQEFENSLLQFLENDETNQNIPSKSAAKFECPATNYTFPDPDNCGNYIQCYDDGTSELHSCPTGQHFNYALKHCTAPCDAYCDENLACECDWPTCKHSRMFLPRASLKFDCPPTNYTFPDPDNCANYIQCYENGTSELHSCPSGQHFNYALKHCTAPCDAYCDQSLACECDWPTCKHSPKFLHRASLKFDCPLTNYTFPDPDNCANYIQCYENGTSELHSCPSGQHFNYALKLCMAHCDAYCDQSLACECNWPMCRHRVTFRSKASLQFDCPPTNYTFPDPDNCANYIQCYENGTSELHSCPSGQHFNYALKHCTALCDAYCDESLACECDWPTCKHTPMLLPRASLKFDCPPTNYTFPDPDNCASYIQCYENGTSELHSCPSGQHFNYALKHCTAPCDAYCDQSLACECNWPNCKRSFKVNSKVSLEFNCPATNYTFPDPDNCANYIQCYEDGTSEFYSCPTGQHFNYALKHCTAPCDAYCDQSLECECDWPTCKKPPTVLNASICDQGDIAAVDTSCTLFSVCSDGLQYVLTCPEGLHFNKDKLRCEKPCDAHCDTDLACDCEWTSCGETSTSVNNFVCVDDGVHAVNGSCSSYIKCSYGKADVVACPNGKHFSKEKGRCVSPCKAHCEQSLACECQWSTCSFQCPSLYGEYSDLYDCSMYYNCTNGFPEIIKCPDETYYNYEARKCVDAAEAKCVFECFKPDEVISHPLDCSKYIQCTNSKPTVKTCGEGQAFNWKKRQCDSWEGTECINY